MDEKRCPGKAVACPVCPWQKRETADLFPVFIEGQLLVERGGSADPEEVASSGSHGGDWTPAERREAVRRAVRRMAAAGEIEVRQAGRRVDPSTARGALQVRLLREGDPRPGWRTD